MIPASNIIVYSADDVSFLIKPEIMSILNMPAVVCKFQTGKSSRAGFSVHPDYRYAGELKMEKSTRIRKGNINDMPYCSA